MKDFWETHHWPQGEQRVHWHLLFDDQVAVHAFARAHAELIGRYSELTPVPTEWLHATIQSIGPLTPAQTDAIAAAARPVLRDLAPFDLEIGPAQAIHNGIVTALYPEEELADVFWALRRATEGILGAELLPPAPARFWPHMSLAYSNARWDADDLARALVRLRPARARMRVTRVALVEQQQLWRDKYTWSPIAEVLLGQGLQSGAELTVVPQSGGHRP